jgi:dihydroxy-acid dehydratase
MACIAETLGFVLPGGGSIPAVHSERLRFGERTGTLAVALARNRGPTPRSLVTAASIRNAITVLQAIGGSTNAVIHLAAIAGRAGIPFELADLDSAGVDVPVLVDLKPIGTGFMQDFHHAGGLPALMRRIATRLDLRTPTADGRTIADVLDTWPGRIDDRVIRDISNPVATGPAIATLRGNLAPDGAVLKAAAASLALLQHEGPALVFDGLADLDARIDDPDLPVTADHVLVLRGAGPVGGPGMPEAGSVPIPAKLARQGVRDMVRVSDARMSGTARGTVILHVAPEAAVGGPLALIRDGDTVRLDFAARRLDLLVDDDELGRRRDTFERAPLPPRGYARLYAEHVTQADAGCDFDFLREPRSP